MADDRKPKPNKLAEFEESQAGLRASIEESRRLTEESQDLLDQHRRNNRSGDG